MVDEIIPQCDIGAMLYNVSTIKLTKAQKRWRLSIFSIRFTNTLLSTASVKKLVYNNPISGIVTTPSCTAPTVFIPLATNSDDHGPRFASIDLSELNNLVQNKDFELLHKFNGVKGLAESLDTNLERGISTSNHDIQTRKIAFGSNTYKKPPLKGFVYFLVEALKDTTVLILLTCAAISLGFGVKENGAKEGWHEGGGIFVAVFLVNTVSALSNLRQERHFGRLSKMDNNVETDVIREGKRQKIPISSVVVGDVVVLSTRDQIPAHGLCIDGHSLLVDESRITGKIHPTNIDATKNPFLFSGSKVAYGQGQMLVTSVGMNTSWGKMMMSSVTDDSNKQMPKRSSLNKLTSWTAMFGLAGTFLDLLITSIRYGTGFKKDKNGNWEFNGECTDTNDILNSFVNVGVSTSEGLLLATNLTLACSIERMMADQLAMVRKKSACETLGSVDVICTDKTGVLTLNSMKVDEFWIGIHLIKLGDLSGIIDKRVLQLYHEGVGLNTTVPVYKSVPEYSGSPTEKAILSWAVRNLGMDMEKVKQEDFTILHVETFNPEKKRSGVSVKKKGGNTIHVHWKGAAEMVLAMCSNYYQQNGLVNSINHEEKTQLEKIIQGMAARKLRCIAFAHKEEDATSDNISEQGLTLLGIIGIKDPCRQEAREAIDTCKSAGVEIKMITGDNVFTAKAIATECGILEAGQHVSEGEVIDGEEFRNYTDDERMEKVESIKVMARSSPSDKLLMVQCLKRKGHVVAVTGHSTHDVPALKEADVGLSMGIQGTEVAIEHSDIVILNDDIRSVVMVLTWGRCVYNNIQKFIQFQFTAIAAALVINFVKAAAGAIPLIPVQQLWINLVINISGSLALTTEPPTKELMHQSPVGRDAHAPLVTNVMWRNLIAQSVYQMVILLTFQFRGTSFFKVSKTVNDIIIFNTFVLCQVFNKFNSRKLEKTNVFEGLHKKRLFIGIIGMTVALHVVIVELLNDFADTKKLTWEQWGICITTAALSCPIGWTLKLIPVQERPLLSYIQEWIL